MRIYRRILSALVSFLVTAQLAAAPLPITVSSTADHIPGRYDYIQTGGSFTLTVDVPEGTPVDWYFNNELIEQSASASLQFQNVGSTRTGNYQAFWSYQGRPCSSEILPITIGPLPTSNFGDQTTAAGLKDHNARVTLHRVLPDGRLHASVGHRGGLKIVTSSLLYSADLEESVLLSLDPGINGDSVLGVFNDGSYLTSRAPHLNASPDQALSFTMPTVLLYSPWIAPPTASY